MGIIHVGRMKGRWRRPIALVAALAVAAGLAAYLNRDHPAVKQATTFASRAPSVLSVGSDVTPTPPAQAAAPTQATPRAAPTPQTKVEQYAAWTAPNATPEMLSQAYVYAMHCIVERRVYQYGLETTGQGTETHPQAFQKCALGPGHPDNATWKRILEARVKLNAYGAISDVLDARSTAFADDPEGWKRLYNEAYRKGLEGAEPVVMTGESVMAYMEGDYRKAAIYAIASAIGRAQEAGLPNVDLDKEHRVVQAMAKVPVDQRPIVIIEGQELARKWRKAS